MNNITEFTFETTYNQKAMNTMARALRKTVRKKHSRRSHIFGWIITVLAVLLVLPIGEREVVFNFRTVITWAVIVIIVATLLFEDWINGYIARKRMLPGTAFALCTFGEDDYVSETKAGKTEWKYENIETIAETKDYFVFLFGKNHAQVYDKNSLQGGSIEEFRTFLVKKTEKEFWSVK